MSEQVRVPVAQEEVVVNKRRNTSGRVTITTSTRTVDALAAAALERADVIVERVPVNREVDQVPSVHEEGNTTVIPVVEEVLVKRLVLKEEIRLTRSSSTEHVEMPVTLRKQVATVERQETANRDQGEDQ